MPAPSRENACALLGIDFVCLHLTKININCVVYQLLRATINNSKETVVRYISVKYEIVKGITLYK
jgi:hypothetical protein